MQNKNIYYNKKKYIYIIFDLKRNKENKFDNLVIMGK